MSEVFEQFEAAEHLPLMAVHEHNGAVLGEQHGWLVPVHYGDSQAEYAMVRNGGTGLIDLSMRGRIEVSGAEAVQFLNGMVTNDVKALEDHAWMPAAFPNVQGRLIASTRFLRVDDTFLIETESASHVAVIKLLERFTLAGDFRVADRTAETATISVQGRSSVEAIRAALGEEAASVARGRIATAQSGDVLVNVMRATHTGEDGFDLFVKAEQAAALWDKLTAAGARPIGLDAIEILRVEAGIQRDKVDMDESVIVLEAALDDAISYTKGCYVGQEIIARIHWRGHVARRLAGLKFDDNRAVQPSAKVRAMDGKEIGRITSAVVSPQLNQTVALGYVKYNYLAPGTEVKVVSETGEERPAKVTELPFVRGSWFDASSSAITV